MSKPKRSIVLSAALSAAMMGCGGPDPVEPVPANAEIGLRRMADCDDLETRLVDTLTESVIQSRYGWRGYYPPMAGGMEEDAAADSDGGGGGGGSGPTDFTGTTVQEEGVDELDIVKTNGTELFVAQDRALHIVKSWPAAESEQLATVPLEGWARGLFLVGESTVVVVEDVAASEVGAGAEAWWSVVRVRTIDVSDPSHPLDVHTTDIEGWLTDARMIDNRVFLVINQYTDFPAEIWEAAWAAAESLPTPSGDADEAAWTASESVARGLLRPYIETLLDTVSLDEVLPQAREGATGAFSSLYACEDIYAPHDLSPLSMLSVAEVDPATGAVEASGLMSDGWTIYSSPTSLYVAQTSQWWWGWSGDAGKSHIHRFDLTGDSPVYTGSGSVDGWLYDQFAMSEHNGHLRVVTTDFGWWGWGGGGVAVDVAVEESDAPPEEGGGSSSGSEGGAEGGSSGEDPPAEDTDEEPTTPDEPVEEPPVTEGPQNHLFVLELAEDGSLPAVGHLSGFGAGETVQAVRLMGEKGYVITFRQTDPLFTLDLADPANPAIVGELHMPGYSAYLHPLDADHLIGVGMAGLETGQLTGLAVTLFDVSDMANPTLLDQYEIDPGQDAWSWSEALWDHHAFTFHRDVLTIPAYTSSYDEVSGAYSGFSGTISLNITVDGGITETGRVDHADLVAESICLYDMWWGGREEGDIVVDDGDDDGGSDDPSGGEAPGDPEPGGDVGDTGGDPTEDPDAPDGGGTDAEFSYCDPQYGYWYASVRRSVYIEDNLYTISDYGVKVNALNDPSVEIAQVLFYPAPVE